MEKKKKGYQSIDEYIKFFSENIQKKLTE